MTAWLILGVSSLGYGRLWQRVSGLGNEAISYCHLCLVGLALLCGLSLALVSVSPLGGPVGISVLLIGSALGARELFLRVTWRAFLRYLIPLVAFSGLLAWQLAAIGSIESYDSNLYHLQQVRWMRSHGTPLGLANLHVRLGTQSSHLSLAALMEQWILVGRSAWFMGAVWPIMACWWCLGSIRRSLAQGEASVVLVYCCVVLPLLCHKLLSLSPNLYFDDAAGVAQVILVGESLRLAFSRTLDAAAIRVAKNVVLLLAVCCVTLKVSGAATAISALGLLAIFHRGMWPSVGMVGIAAGIMGAYFTRNAMLSGWLLFPAPLGELPVRWAMPAGMRNNVEIALHQEALHTVLGQYEIIKAWARLPGREYVNAISGGFRAWFPAWSEVFVRSFEMKLMLAALAAVLFRSVCIRPRVEPREVLVVVSLGLMPVAYWFFTAPDLRFGALNFWILCALCVSIAAARLRVPSRVWPAASAVCAFVWCGSLLIPSGSPSIWMTPKAARLPTKEVDVAPGLTIRVPAKSGDDRCGNAQVPCTPYYRQTLRFERDGERFRRFWVVSPEKG